MTHRLGLFLLCAVVCSVRAWLVCSPFMQSSRSKAVVARSRTTSPCTEMQHLPASDSGSHSTLSIHELTTRRGLLVHSFVVASSTILSTSSRPANALVKGNAPPSSMKPMSEKPKCTNVDECQAMAERKQLEEDSNMPKGAPPKVTSAGTRYIDMDIGSEDTPSVKNGDDVTLYYKVLKLGKRSYDGLSGEGTVVFSRGYGLEDDEKVPGTISFQTAIGDPKNIAALNDGVVGMHVGGTRRFTIVPQEGWEKPTRICDGGPGGRGAGGDLKTDYVIVPTATMVATEECFDKRKLPFPTSYAQERRMAQRFDQSLIMEVQLVGINK